MTHKNNSKYQATRRDKLNKIAQEAGYKNWSEYETAVINQIIKLPQK
jgi:hypothetical protein